MLETQFYGKILPSHPDIKPVLLDIRKKYQIPEISPNDNGFKILLANDLEIEWEAVHSEILERLKDIPDLLPEKTRSAYLQYKEFQRKGLVDPELDTISEKLRGNINALFDLFMKIYQPTAEQFDSFYRVLTNHCVEFLLTGEAREIPQDWMAFVKTLVDNDGQKTIVAMANQMADPDVVAEQFKAEYAKAFGKHRPKITEAQVESADYLRMKWFGKDMDYLLEEEEQRKPEEYSGRKSTRYTTATRRHHSKMRQKLYRLQRNLFEILK